MSKQEIKNAFIEKAKAAAEDAKVILPPSPLAPPGTEAYALARDGEHWSVYRFTVTHDGVACGKIVEKTMYQLAVEEVGRRTVDFQIRLVK